MARPINKDQFAYAFGLYKDRKNTGFTPTGTDIADNLSRKFPDSAVGERAVRNWFPKFEAILQVIGLELDSPFELHRLDEYKIGAEEIKDVVFIWTLVKRASATSRERWKDKGIPDVLVPEPTVRQAQWWGRVMRMCPSLRLDAGVKRITGAQSRFGCAAFDVCSVAGAYVVRELRRDVLGETVGFRDLDGVLAYAPWQGDYSARRYEAAIADGVIPELIGTSKDDYSSLVGIADAKGFFNEAVVSPQGRVASAVVFLSGTHWPRPNAATSWQLPTAILLPQLNKEKETGEAPTL
jgi:hypothetical protein